jgi:D-Tyr-tRNAtyr deacylase
MSRLYSEIKISRIIGNGLSNGKNKDWVKEYRDEQINQWLIEILLLIGLSKKDVKYEVRFVNSRIEELYILNKNKSVKHLGKKINFKKGDIMITAISYKHTKEDFEKIIKKFFDKVKIFTDKEETYALAFCEV